MFGQTHEAEAKKTETHLQNQAHTEGLHSLAFSVTAPCVWEVA